MRERGFSRFDSHTRTRPRTGPSEEARADAARANFRRRDVRRLVAERGSAPSKGWDFLLREVLPALQGRATLADAIAESVAGVHCAAKGVDRGGPRSRAREHRRCVRDQIAAGANCAVAWLESGGSGTAEEGHREAGCSKWQLDWTDW